jgi:6-phospho-beta-glucosidase
MYADPLLDEKPALLEQRGGAYYSEAAVALASSLLNNTGDVQVVNTLNNGTLPFLPDDAVIEVPAVVDALGARPVDVSPVEPLYSGLISHVTAYEQLALDAAVNGGADRVFDALLAHPLVGQISLARELTDKLLAHNAAYLPWAQ